MKNLAYLVLSLAACATDSNTPGGGDDDGTGDGAPPFTDGTSTLSGSAEASFADGNRGVARFNNPVNVAYKDGKIYVADFDNSKLRVVDAVTGQTSTLIAQANFRKPFAMAFDGDTLYVTTDCNSTSAMQGPMTGSIWKINGATATVVAENIGRPRGLAVIDGKLAVSDYQHHVVRLIDMATGAASNLAGVWDAAGMLDGTGVTSKFSTPYGMAVVDGGLIVADFDNNRLRRIEMDGTVTTIAGGGTAGFADGAAATAKLAQPQGVAAIGGTIYFTDLGNFRVRKLEAGNVSTVAGDGTGGYIDADDTLASELFGLEGLTVADDGSFVFVADGNRGNDGPYNRVRMIEIH